METIARADLAQRLKAGYIIRGISVNMWLEYGFGKSLGLADWQP